ncbi:hypothetical protein HK405_005426 [Cladochytrium tenue]|nr:hypothetical protein HK405_005426 [Cladochytrium tenue]
MNALTAGALFEDEESRQLPGKELARKQIAEIDKLDKLIYGLESLVSMHKLSKGRDVQVAIANFSTDADKNIQSTEELKEEVHRLRKQNEEMDIVIAKKNEKLELLESGKGAVNNMLAPGASFEDSPQYQEMSRLLSQQRQTLEDRDSLVRALKTQIQELRSQEHQLELNEFEHLKQLAAAGIIISKQSSLTSESMAARVRELESALDGERRLREFEQTKDADTIATLQSELTVLKAGTPSTTMITDYAGSADGGLARAIEEEGRERDATYFLPSDSRERTRLHVQHILFRHLFGGLFHTPQTELFSDQSPATSGGDRAKILDMGCGPGSWALEMAVKYPHASVFGGDPISYDHKNLPENLVFSIENVIEGLSFPDNTFDLVYQV